MKRDDLTPRENYEATYCPEDDKLRLYVGRVPRDEYEYLRAEGWTSTPKQDCDFVAVWTPEREATALHYAGFIGDEDTPPTERAADRAERFGGYLEKRTAEAIGHADTYDAGPAAHGFQSERKAEKAAARHDRQAGKAETQWNKAEYWQRRTAGVISHALHKSSPGVRMGRIKTLEAELRKTEKSWTEATERAQAKYDALLSVVEHAAGTREKLKPACRQGLVWALSSIRDAEGATDDATPEQFRRAVIASALGDYRASEADEAKAKEARAGTRPAADIAAEWLEGRTRPENWDAETGTEWTRHLRLRLAYEHQMLEAQGGRAAMVEMEVGGFIGGHQIRKINRSNVTGRVVSVGIMFPTNGKNRWGNPDPKAPEMRLEIVNVERFPAESYRAPTDEEKAALAATVKTEKAAAPKAEPCPLINPTDEDAEKLQNLWNEKAMADPWYKSNGGKPSEVLRMTQAQYSAASSGTHSRYSTVTVCELGTEHVRRNGDLITRKDVYKVRTAGGGYGADRVVVITDKPQKPVPWAAVEAARAACPSPEKLKPRAAELAAVLRTSWSSDWTDDQKQLVQDARYCGLARWASMSQFGLTEAGEKFFAA